MPCLNSAGEHEPDVGPDHPVIVPAGKTPGKKKITPPTFQKKELATLEQRIEILDWYHANGKNQSKTAKHFDPIYPNLRIKQPLVSSWVNKEQEWRATYANHDGAAQKVKRLRQTQHPEVDQMLELWVAQAMSHKIQVSGEVLRQKWTAFADLVGIPADETSGSRTSDPISRRMSSRSMPESCGASRHIIGSVTSSH
jgi:transposase